MLRRASAPAVPKGLAASPRARFLTGSTPLQKSLIVIVGTTGTGKSALAVALAKRFGGEVVSADSRQVYRDIDIGTSKITTYEMKGVPHHLLNVSSLRRVYTAAHFKRDAERAIRAIWRRGKVPIICGGTGFYIRAVVDGLVLPAVSPSHTLRKNLEKKTTAELFRMLKKRDPARARTIDPKNPHRLIRALEIVAALGKVPKMHAQPINAKTLFIGLALPKKELEKRTHARIRLWLRRGLLKEAERVPLHRIGELGLVYRWAARLIRKEISRTAFIDGLTRDLLAYAKRQTTWFVRDQRIHWVHNADTAFSHARVFLASQKRPHTALRVGSNFRPKQRMQRTAAAGRY